MPRCTPITSNSGGHLAVLVGKAIQKDGLNCDLNHIDVSGVEDFKGVFRKWPKFQGDISKWVIHGINADAMFDVVPLEPVVATDNKHLQALIRQALHVNGDASSLNHIDVSGITDFSDVFVESPTFKGDISGWNVSNATTMQSMFKGCAFDGDISRWDVSNVQSMDNMFAQSRFNGDISRWNVSKVRNMERVFQWSVFNNDISQWNTAAVLSMRAMFYCSKFNQPIGEWDVSNVKSMRKMFECSCFTGDISGWNVSQVIGTSKMFGTSSNIFGASAFSQDISQWEFSPKLEDKDLAEIYSGNPHFLAAQSMSAWIVRLHLLNSVTPTDLAWKQAFALSAPVAEGLGLSLQDHVQAIVAMHAKIVGEALGPDDVGNPVDAALFV